MNTSPAALFCYQFGKKLGKSGMSAFVVSPAFLRSETSWTSIKSTTHNTFRYSRVRFYASVGQSQTATLLTNSIEQN